MFENFQVPQELKPSDPRFGCGPSKIPVEHIEALAKTGFKILGTSHRQSTIKNLVKELQDGLKTYFKMPADYQVVLGNGGATLLFDMIALGVVKKKTAHFTCGEFSQKWFLSSKNVPWISSEEFKCEMGTGIDAHMVPGADTVCFTLNETSTGVQNTVVPTVPSDVVLCCDATSGAGQVPCDVSKIDIFFFSPQKVFASDGGLWCALMSPKAIARCTEIRADKTRFIPPIMDWSHAIDNSSKNQTYNTPALSTIFLFNEQVKKMNLLGYSKVVEMAQKKSDLLYGWAEKNSYLSVYVKEKKYRSICVGCVDVIDKVLVDDLLKKLRTEKAVLDIDGYRKLGRNQFRISMFHNITIEDMDKLTRLLSKAIESQL